MVATLDSFVGTLEPHATFHDASLLRLTLDFESRRAELAFELAVGDPDSKDNSARERRRHGTLSIAGLHFWVVEPPATSLERSRSGLPWLTADGPLSESDALVARSLAAATPTSASAWYLFFSNWNAFMYFAADEIAYSWTSLA